MGKGNSSTYHLMRYMYIATHMDPGTDLGIQCYRITGSKFSVPKFKR